MSWGDTIGCIVVFTVVFSITKCLTMLAIKFNKSKKSQSTLKQQYPYFTNPFYKKFMLCGLKGALHPAIFIFNIILFVSLILSASFLVISMVTENNIIIYFSRCFVGCYGISFIVFLLLFIALPLKF